MILGKRYKTWCRRNRKIDCARFKSGIVLIYIVRARYILGANKKKNNIMSRTPLMERVQFLMVTNSEQLKQQNNFHVEEGIAMIAETMCVSVCVYDMCASWVHNAQL